MKITYKFQSFVALVNVFNLNEFSFLGNKFHLLTTKRKQFLPKFQMNSMSIKI